MTSVPQPKTYINLKDTAKLIRHDLKVTWPGVKFSVTGKSYSGGASITVSWIDGPTQRMVERVTKRYEGSTFDGQIDLKSYVDDERDGQRVHYASDHVMSNRRYSATQTAVAMARICQAFGVKPLPLKETEWGTRVLTEGISRDERTLPRQLALGSGRANADLIELGGDWIEVAIQRLLAKTSCVKKPRMTVHLVPKRA